MIPLLAIGIGIILGAVYAFDKSEKRKYERWAVKKELEIEALVAANTLKMQRMIDFALKEEEKK